MDKSYLLSVIVAREALGSTGVGDGIAIPHVRNPIVLHIPQPLVTLCFLERAIEFEALDGKPVHTLFAMVSPTIAVHLNLLSKLAFALRQSEFAAVIARRGTPDEILKLAARVDGSVSGRPAASSPAGGGGGGR
jgi:nitrogen PTS system EIIA component